VSAAGVTPKIVLCSLRAIDAVMKRREPRELPSKATRRWWSTAPKKFPVVSVTSKSVLA
jgi:hypothetical protein